MSERLRSQGKFTTRAKLDAAEQFRQSLWARVRRRKIAADPTHTRFWVVVQFYEPFTMGGDVWARRRYEVDGLPFEVDGHRFFAFEQGDKWAVHEVGSGGCVARVDWFQDAAGRVTDLLAETPDFAAQKERMGRWEGVEVVERAEAERRLAKTDEARSATHREGEGG